MASGKEELRVYITQEGPILVTNNQNHLQNREAGYALNPFPHETIEGSVVYHKEAYQTGQRVQIVPLPQRMQSAMSRIPRELRGSIGPYTIHELRPVTFAWYQKVAKEHLDKSGRPDSPHIDDIIRQHLQTRPTATSAYFSAVNPDDPKLFSK